MNLATHLSFPPIACNWFIFSVEMVLLLNFQFHQFIRFFIQIPKTFSHWMSTNREFKKWYQRERYHLLMAARLCLSAWAQSCWWQPLPATGAPNASCRFLFCFCCSWAPFFLIAVSAGLVQWLWKAGGGLRLWFFSLLHSFLLRFSSLLICEMSSEFLLLWPSVFSFLSKHESPV